MQWKSTSCAYGLKIVTGLIFVDVMFPPFGLPSFSPASATIQKRRATRIYPPRLLSCSLLLFRTNNNNKGRGTSIQCNSVQNTVAKRYWCAWQKVRSRADFFCALLKKLKAKMTQCFGQKLKDFFSTKLEVMRPNPKPGGIEL